MAFVKIVKRSAKKRLGRGKKRSMAKKRVPRNSLLRRSADIAKVRETYQLQILAGNMNFFVDALANLNFDRAQTVAEAYQQYRIAYMKLTFRPNFDTYVAPAVVAGNPVVPQMYFMLDKTASIPTNADANTLNSVGARPIRIDDKNVVRYWKPSVLTADATAPGVTTAQQYKISPWLSTNQNSGNPIGNWAPSEVLHRGAVFYITKSTVNDAQPYTVDVEVLFEFRKPNWYIPQSQSVGTNIGFHSKTDQSPVLNELPGPM